MLSGIRASTQAKENDYLADKTSQRGYHLQDGNVVKAGFLSLWLLISLLWIQPAFAQRFEAGIEESNWSVAASALECRLRHRVPGFGDAEFVRSAGVPMRFLLESWQSRLRGGKAILAAEAPPWKTGEPVQLGEVRVSPGRKVVRLQEPRALRVLDELGQGNTMVFAQPASPDSAGAVRVALSAANFRGVYSDYLNCLAELMPVNFAQISKSVLLYGDGQRQFSSANRERLDLVARYVKADSNVGRVLVDGHSDRRGRSDANRRLSRQRAYAVTAYLIAQGVPERIITTRYHGERYPAAGKRISEARNRRVTVRLELADPAAGLVADQDQGIQTRPRFDASL